MKRTCVLALLCCLGIHGGTAADTAKELWQSFVANPDDHSHLPNNAFAGYQYGEVPLPEHPVVVSVMDFGAVADGQTDNSKAFRDAMEAAYLAGGGAVRVPEGTYLLEDPVWIHRSGIVLRGDGVKQTTLRFARPLVESVGNANPMGTNIWAWSGGLVWMGPRDYVVRYNGNTDAMDLETRDSHQGYKSSGSTWEYWREQQVLSRVTGTHPRGSRELTVEDGTAFRAGQFVMLTYENRPDLGFLKEIGQAEPFQSWEHFGQWFQSDSFPRWQWPVEIAAVEENRIRLREPLRVAVRPEFGVRIWDPGPVVRESGVEDLRIEHDGEAEDDGWNGVFLHRTLHCWVRGVEVVNGVNGFHVSASKNPTLRDTSVISDRWMHHPYTNRTMTSNQLVENFRIQISEDRRGGTHGLNTEFLSSGSVWSRGDMNRGTLDTHRGMPFDFIRTDIRLRNEKESNPGGSSKAGAYAGRRTVHWNIEVTGGGNNGNYVFQPDTHTFGALVGIQGAERSDAPTWNASGGTVMPRGDKNVLIADPGEVPTPPNLYEAQKQARASGESWVHVVEPVSSILHPETKSVRLRAVANGGAGQIGSLEFRVNGESVGVRLTPPYTMVWTPSGPGRHVVEVIVKDGEGREISAEKIFTVGRRIRLEGEDPEAFPGSSDPMKIISGSYHYGGATAYFASKDDAVEFSFHGTRFEIYSDGAIYHKSSFTVELNGKEIADVDIRGKAGNRHLAFDSGEIPNQSHTVRIINKTNRMTIDAVILTTTESPR